MVAQLDGYNAQVFDYTYGIRPGNIISLTRDKQGFLWILYTRSIQRFDGRKTDSFTPKGPFEYMYCDDAGRVWVTTRQMVYLFEPAKQEFVEVPIEPIDTTRRLGQVFKLPGRRTCLITSNAFFQLDTTTNTFVRILEDLSVAPPYDVNAFAFRQSTFYFGHRGWIFRYNTNDGHLDSLPDMNVRRIYALNEELIQVATWGLSSYWLDFKKGETRKILISSKEGGPRDKDIGIRSLIKVSPYKFIIAAREGLMDYDTRLDIFTPVKLYYRGKRVNTRDLASALHYDDNWFVWMATPEGVWWFSLFNKTFGLYQLHDTASDLPFGIDNIRSIAEDQQGLLWLGTGHGFASWDRVKNETKLYLPEEGSITKLAYPSIRGISCDEQNIILAPADLGVWIFNPKTNSYKRPVYASKDVEKRSSGDFLMPSQNFEMEISC